MLLHSSSGPRPRSSGRSGAAVVEERSADLLRLPDGLDLGMSSAEPEYRLSKWLSDARRWELFMQGLRAAAAVGSLDEAALDTVIGEFEKEWQYRGFNGSGSESTS
ncbi:hypothetical protein XA68_18444 [Ophiocordyceps unilateralis]|uniref:Uncharacterized protein n=1 Tax=Ophiocordyceps unilateralis TaxID=268505 RepID=A0A2A9P323_OPHUN|nr:hypothetical protein XA68_18444 [Ophiocordyceps unilateralis]